MRVWPFDLALSVLAIVMAMMVVQLVLCTVAICRLRREVRELRDLLADGDPPDGVGGCRMVRLRAYQYD